MKKTNTTIEQNQEDTTVNPFNFDTTTSVSTTSRKLDLTPVLNGTAQARATTIIQATTTRPELRPLAQKMLDTLDVADLISLIGEVFSEADIKADALLLAEADDDQLSRLLESRRSDRSKTKAKNPKTSMVVCVNYIASMYAELMVRSAWNKPYQSNSATEYGTFNSDDKDVLTKKIKSLQSKQCRLGKTAAFVPADKIALDETVAEIARLNQLRGTNVKSTSVVKDINIDQIREALKAINPDTLDEASLIRYNELVTKVG